MKIIDYPLRLLIVCVIAAGLLAFVYESTSKTIEINNEKEKISKVKMVLPKDVDEIKEFKAENPYYKGIKSGKVVGYAIVSSSKGYGGDINILVGIDTNRKITKIEILSHKETPGLGAKIEDKNFLAQFFGKTKVESVLKKDDSLNGQIDAIAAATISSRAFTKAVQKAFKIYDEAAKNDK